MSRIPCPMLQCPNEREAAALRAERDKLLAALTSLHEPASGTSPEVKEIEDRWASMDQFIYGKRHPDSWIDHARKDIPQLIAWLRTERTMHNAWRKRAEEAEAALAVATSGMAKLIADLRDGKRVKGVSK